MICCFEMMVRLKMDLAYKTTPTDFHYIRKSGSEFRVQSSRLKALNPEPGTLNSIRNEYNRSMRKKVM